LRNAAQESAAPFDAADRSEVERLLEKLEEMLRTCSELVESLGGTRPTYTDGPVPDPRSISTFG